MDWSLGRYETIAAQLHPAAEVIVEAADPRPGDRVLDLGCGTGNAALLAAERGTRVTGVDPALRLLDVAALEAQSRGLDAPPGPPPFPWHDAGAPDALMGPHGFTISTAEHPHSFTASSARAFVEDEARDHPLRVTGGAVLEPRGEAEAVLERTLEILEAADEDPDAFRVTSRHVVATASRA